MQTYDLIIDGGSLRIRSAKDLSIPDTLRPIQKKAVEICMELGTNQIGKYVIMPTGTGKTYVQCALSKIFHDHSCYTTFITKASNKNSYQDLLKEMGVTSYSLISHGGKSILQELRKIKVANKRFVVIVDEAHLFHNREETFLSSLMAITKNQNLYFFSATPVVSSMLDLGIVLCLETTQARILHAEDYYGILTEIDDVTLDGRTKEEFLANFVYTNFNPGIPTLKPLITDEIMLSKEEDKELSLLGKDNGEAISFALAVDMETHLELAATKIAYLRDIKSRGPIIVYTSFVAKIELYAHHLPMPYVILAKNKSQREISMSMDQCNAQRNTDGSIVKYIFIGPGMSEGVSFSHVTDVVFMSPPATYSMYKQIVGRATRLNSLLQLDEDDRYIIPRILIAVSDNRKTHDQVVLEKLEENLKLFDQTEILLSPVDFWYNHGDDRSREVLA